VDDLRRMLAAMAEPDVQRPDRGSAGETAPLLYRLGGFFDTLCDEPVRQVFDVACRRLAGAGARIERRDLPPSFADVHRMHRRIMAAEAAEYHRQQFVVHRAEYGPHIAALVEEGLALSAVDYVEAVQHRAVLIGEFEKLLEGGIALVPATTSTAPGLESTGNPAFNSPISYAGVPTVNLPCGLAMDGMPCGLQLISAQPGSEASLLDAAAWCERQLDFRERPRL
jgi:aspartyl-tRNA(Asn)/glutamyl-tRNA(Gln) amidotransferase subunit A